MNSYYWSLLVLSAVLYALPFFFSHTVWWLVFIFAVPFLWVTMHNRMTFLQGYIWGLTLFSLHTSGIALAITRMAHGPWYIRILPSIFIILYASLWSGLFFWLTQTGIRLINWEKKPHYSLFGWVLGLYKFIYFIDTSSLFLFDHCEGYPFMHPLLPLTEKMPLLSLLPFLGKETLTLFLLMVPTSILLLVVCTNRYSLFLMTATLLFWVISIRYEHEHGPSPVWLDHLVALPHVFYHPTDIDGVHTQACTLFKNIIAQYPQVDLIITPESAFYNTLLSQPELSTVWNNHTLSKNVHLMIGTFRNKKGKYYNSLHWIYDGTIQHCFDKRHSMLLTERIPLLFNYTCIKDLYFKTFPPMRTSKKKRPLFNVNQDFSFVPYICSELFFNEQPDDIYPNSLIIVVCNDRWFKGYFPTLMHCLARFKALYWQRPIVYISFYNQSFFDQYGHQAPVHAHYPKKCS